MEAQEVPRPYVDILKALYENQTATVRAAAGSREFSIGRGIRQGDPLSALLFSMVMETIFGALKKKWAALNRRRSGQYIGLVIDDPEDTLSNLRFADDVILLATGPRDLKKMLNDLAAEASKYGLKIHTGKTTVMTNASCPRPAVLNLSVGPVQVAPGNVPQKYLGRLLSVDDPHRTELRNRIACGWAAFMKNKGALCNKKLPISDRIRLFNSVVVPCVLYGCGAWTTTTACEQLLVTTRRKMLRWMTQTVRNPDEIWVDYVKRATHISEDLAAQHGCKKWVEMQRQRHWSLAGKVAAAEDRRWANRILDWKPWFRFTRCRPAGRPCKRWHDNITQFAGGSWVEAAKDPCLWLALSQGYVEKLVPARGSAA